MKFLILGFILTIVNCASLDNLAYLPPNQRSPNPLSNQYLPASNHLSSGVFGSSSPESSTNTLSINQNRGGFASNAPFGSFGASGGSFGSYDSSYKNSGGSFNSNQRGQASFNPQRLSTSYGGYSGAGNAFGSSQTNFKKNSNQIIGEASIGASLKNQGNSEYSGYSSSSSSSSGSSFGGYAGPSGQTSLKSRESLIPILKLANDNNGDGTYKYSYETANSISAEEQGDARNGGTSAQGSFGYSAPDGQHISISYTADENGFLPQGSHIPTPPPIPQAILKSIEENAAAAAKGNYNEGAYRREGLNEASYNANAGSGFHASSSSQSFQGSFDSSAINNLQANALNNGGYKY